MNTAVLKKFAQVARRQLIAQVAAKLKYVLSTDSAELRAKEKPLKDLREAIAASSEKAVVEKVAYIWFNRFCALRFMDINHYTSIGIVSPADGFTQPEMLQEAKQGYIDEEIEKFHDKQKVIDLLNNRAASTDPQQEAYRLLLVAVCNYYHATMPFLFEKIEDYTELLMPDDLLSENSILHATREAMTPDVCEDVEVIGWLYQFYISEKKDEVFDGLKKNKKITPENIPAATQLFTPHWIVRYLVENSLGRLWLLNRPNSKLIEQMDYYIKPEQAETDFLRIDKPEEIKICDPACGSGHMLTYAFDLLYAIYEEEGYEPAEIPSLILTHNLYGIEIDERAGELAAFALTMKARAKQRRFFNKGVKPNICVLENVHFDEGELNSYIDFVGRDLFTAPLHTTLRQFEEADNFGSLIRPDVTDVDSMLRILESKNVSGQLFISMTHQKVLQALRQADYLSPKYHVVIANPPYMGGKGMNGRLSAWLKDNYPDSKSDLMTAFIERCANFIRNLGYQAIVTLDSWMFLTSYRKLRAKILNQQVISSMAHVGWNCFPEGHTYNRGTAFVLREGGGDKSGVFVDLSNVPAVLEKGSLYLQRKRTGEHVYHRSSKDFRILPEGVIAFWASDNLRAVFAKATPLGRLASPRQGLATADNDRFTRLWSEVPFDNIGIGYSNRSEAKKSLLRWFPYNKGGEYRKWYGNQTHLVDWKNDGEEINSFKNAVVRNPDTYFRSSLSWSKVTSAGFSLRYFPAGFVYDVAGCSIFVEKDTDLQKGLIALVNSQIMNGSIKRLSPTINLEVGQVSAFPVIESAVRANLIVIKNAEQLIEHGRFDWNAYETSWDFTSLPLLNPDYRQPTLMSTYPKLRAHWREMTLEMQRLEEENNRIFIDAYGLQDELTPEVPLNEITLTCNPHYRYGNDKSEDELEALLLADTMRELVSYAVGCMFGRYALDKPGLALANQGETLGDYLKQIPEPSFMPDDDNAIPVLDGEWFTDDITERFRRFLKITFGKEHFQENLAFIEKAIGKDIRKYFLKDFYKDHVQRYKKRPIYWMFSSPQGSFNALIYMHRYQPTTVSVVLNGYLREFRTKLMARKDHLEQVSLSASVSSVEKTKALKEIENLKKMIDELETWEREVLYPLASEQIEIDLDDGVKVNYPKFGSALQKIPGLSE